MRSVLRCVCVFVSFDVFFNIVSGTILFGICEDLCVLLAAKLAMMVGHESGLDSMWKTDCTVKSWILVEWCIY